MIDTYFAVNLRIVGTTQDFVDAAAAYLRDVAGDLYEDKDYRIQTGENADGDPVLTAHVPYHDQAEAQAAFDWVKSEAANYLDQIESGTLRLYRTPVGGVTVSGVREWYEANPGEQPTRTLDDGTEEQYVPDRWDPMDHVIDEASV